MEAAIFDLDGVIVDTAKYHYLAWKKLAKILGFDFTEAENERLKGVSRDRSLEILLEIGEIKSDAIDKIKYAEMKNNWYLEYIQKINESEILPGAREYLYRLKDRGIKLALGSASKNAPLILKNLGIYHIFDAIVDGNSVSTAKPDPEVFLKAVELLNVDWKECVVFEDSQAGIQAAITAGMYCIGIGNKKSLYLADEVIEGLHEAHKLRNMNI